MRASFGFASLQQPPPGGYRKVLVAGLGRSGTSSVASLLRNSGYFLGEVENTATREDPTLREMLANGRAAEIRERLDDWASKHELIAWKDPKLVGDEGRKLIHSLPDEWAVIVIFRDPLATTMRLVSQHGGDLVDRLTTAVRRQKKLLKLVQETQKTMLLVSYEKLMSQPEKVCGELLGFLIPDRARGIDVGSVWSKTLADQRMYRAAADGARARTESVAPAVVGEPAPTQVANVSRRRAAKRRRSAT